MTCFIDLDGVLADYYAGVCRAFGLEPWPYKMPFGDWNFFAHAPLNKTDADVAPLMTADFYANLPLLPDAHEIVARAEAAYGDRVFFLSSPWDTPGCCDGKSAWVKRMFPKYARKLLIGSAKEACAHDHSVLWDDSPKNVEKFKHAGGRAVLIPRPWNDGHGYSSKYDGRCLILLKEV